MKSPLILTLSTAMLFGCITLAASQNPYPTDCNVWITETIHCSDPEGNYQTNCSGSLLVIDYQAPGEGTQTENNGTLACTCTDPGPNCGTPTSKIKCSAVPGWLIPQDNSEYCNGSGGGGGGNGGGC